MLDVVAVILENEFGDILIAKRKKGKELEGYWEFPGGKVEKNETPENSLKREIKEEMNIDIRVGSFVGESIYKYERGTIKLLAYKGNIIRGEITLLDHDEYRWVKYKELKLYKLAPADVPLVELIKI
ncbi:(deoxy)nucleoside triphosphate pyrophosphohydrolase [Serpentinicella alkaliphila]|uniref:8-oxo-dGTP diphosphatase n=1 Tax=Serpentinicella alkaliphila TaxID=1734049 RepID=A0A4R2TXR8_9FIRM|nr:(deoxy)nucleoside triphosphate pyrophosphohydrolase [Serpentinicella alkaliphila]QUH26813.1 (deoxy)nucleoside triphosphate pyrophosphohydrolase [Serpentinicella alkaliphila]TCQ08036.1 8-oxo-dGTP diphosphatase [Serpentinicella alkaliphila]